MKPLLLLFIACLTAGRVLAVPTADLTAEETRWTMLMITPREDVADSHLIRLPDGRIVLIDAGKLGDAPGAVLKQLQALKVTALDLVVISHFHIDHYGALTELIDAGITIKRVAGNVPNKEAADREMPWGCNLADVASVLEKLKARGIPYVTPKIGERLLELTTPRGTAVTLDVICLYDGVNTPIGMTDVNDTSMIVRLSHGPTRALFTGDLNHNLGAWLATSEFDLKADLLKVPHHGTEGVAPNEFFDRVGAKAALVPSPRALWESARSMRVRNYFIDHGVPAYVSALRGNVTATMTAQGYTIATELP
jgi:competence protein ComEC